MRVHLGSDHAGLELKEHLLNWLADHGYEAVDHGPFVYDALDDYPVFCLRAAEAVAADAGRRQPRRRRSAARATARQIAANKVKGVRARAGVERGDRGPGPRAQRRQRGLGRRPDAHRRGHDPLRRGVPRPPPSPARSGTPGGSRCSRTTRRPATSRRCPSRRSGTGPAGRLRCPRGTPSTGSPRAVREHFAGRVVSVTSPQGRFARVRRAGRRHRAGDRRVLRQAPVRGLRATTGCVHVHLGLYGKFAVHDGARADRPSARSGCGWWPTADERPPAYGDLRGATACELITARAAATLILDRLGPDPLRAGRRPGPGPGRGSRRSRAPIGGLLMDQEVLAGVGNVYRAEVLFRHRRRPAAAGQHAAARHVRGDVGRPRGADGRRRPDAAGSTPCTSTTRPRRWAGCRDVDDHGGEVYVYRRARRAVLRLRQHGPHRGAGGPQPVLVPALPAAVPVPGGR